MRAARADEGKTNDERTMNEERTKKERTMNEEMTKVRRSYLNDTILGKR
ncbi:MAG: hypothetical protein E6494_05485 [Capnocytophaga sp.]|nr:hypothetical protein [Capnocytophaga sp.]MDU6659552.1 hypothetical protein [Capnocytophaga sp.]